MLIIALCKPNQLAPKGDHDNPIAWYKAAFPGKHPAMLTLAPEAESMQDAVVASCIFVGNKYLARNQSGSSRVNIFTAEVLTGQFMANGN